MLKYQESIPKERNGPSTRKRMPCGTKRTRVKRRKERITDSSRKKKDMEGTNIRQVKGL
jgi:hypothetical protein